MDADYQRRKTVVDWTSDGLAPVDALNLEHGNSAIDFYSPTSYLHRLEQPASTCKTLSRRISGMSLWVCVRTGLKPPMKINARKAWI